MTTLFKEYDEIFAGKRNVFSENVEIVANIAEYLPQLVRYGAEKYLHLTPSQLYKTIDADLLKQLKLSDLYGIYRSEKVIPIESDFFDIDRYRYIVSAAYPEEYPYKAKTQVLKIYSRVLNKGEEWPTGFFTSPYGRVYATWCLQAVLKKEIDAGNINKLYSIFSDSSKVLPQLAKVKLHTACVILYDHPVEFLHYSLKKEYKDETLLKFGIFNDEYVSAPSYMKNEKFPQPRTREEMEYYCALRKTRSADEMAKLYNVTLIDIEEWEEDIEEAIGKKPNRDGRKTKLINIPRTPEEKRRFLEFAESHTNYETMKKFHITKSTLRRWVSALGGDPKILGNEKPQSKEEIAELLNLVNTSGRNEAAKKYNVSGATIKRWCEEWGYKNVKRGFLAS